MDGKPSFFSIEIINDEGKIISAVNKQTKILHKCISSLRTESCRKRVKGDIEKGLHNFKEMFVWCPTHSNYICSCQDQVFNLKNNLLLQNPETSKATKKVSLLHFFNMEDHSARTIGSIFNYNLRNSNRIFTVKRDYEIRKGVLSNSNSFFKIDPLQLPKLVSQNDRSSTIKTNGIKRAKNRRKLGRNNGGLTNYEPIVDEASKTASPTLVNPKIEFIYHNNSDTSDEEVVDTSHLPKYGLLSLNGNGYLPVKEYNSRKLVFQHPILKKVFVCKKDEDEANLWLNDLLKSLDLLYTIEKWVVVQRGVLRISKPFHIKNLNTDKQLAN